MSQSKLKATTPRRSRTHKAWLLAVLTGMVVVVVLGIVGNHLHNAKVGSSADPARLAACSGNLQDQCVMAPTVDLYPAGREDAQNPSLRHRKDDVWKSIGGKVESISGARLQLRASSGRTFTVTFPVELQSWWNSTIAPHYNNYQFGVGDTIRVDYNGAKNDRSQAIAAEQIISSALAIDPQTPSNQPIRRYKGE